ncbi:hypothetical protein NKR23_g12085 [Pleurostoma richardsiae]|uniref:Uncharacterized protein n=1 Tax=Pleurostoma richardsiae TaxID=41990 RepID=A0AA38R8X8_9PEZI|nr:hypothetical protein NKR23_g12085 [Pleurostoma richardsiae]
MERTVLDVLVEANPERDSRSVPRGNNSSHRDWIPVSGSQPWTDFNYENLVSIFRKSLSATYRDPPVIDQGSVYDHDIRNEATLDHFLTRFVFPIINGALRRTSRVMEWSEVFYISPGSWCHGSGPPDWGLVSYSRMWESKFYNLLPGDTKLHAKWRPDMDGSEDLGVRRQWLLPVSQITTYAADAECRYGFIITDQRLVVFRFSVEAVGPSSVATRSQRLPLQPTHERVASGDTDISSAVEQMSLDSSGAQSYIDNNPANYEYLPPEYAVVHWSASEGSGQTGYGMDAGYAPDDGQGDGGDGHAVSGQMEEGGNTEEGYGSKGQEVETRAVDWVQSEYGGWEYNGKKHTYYTEKLP